ncbi:MAG: transglutaminase family protein [Acidimicrobiales bacterium]
MSTLELDRTGLRLDRPGSGADRTALDERPLLDDPSDWSLVGRTVFLVTQRISYDYSGCVSDLRQRLMLVPPAVHADQRRLSWRLESSAPGRRSESVDRFGNLVIQYRIPRAEHRVAFTASALVERSIFDTRLVAPVPAFHRQSPLTRPDAELRAVGRDLARGRGSAEALAERACEWTASRLAFRSGVTTTTTTAVQACAFGQGVCQDYAHVMIAVCRAAGLSARYVSGHLLGEGPSHAWVEVLVPTTSGPALRAVAFDPTHNRRAGLNYVSIASGRDYRDVAPTSGTCQAEEPGRLMFAKRVGIAEIDVTDAPLSVTHR